MRALCVVVAAVACHSEPVAPGVAPNHAGDLWSLAPDGAVVGVVISPRALDMADHALADVDAYLSAGDLGPMRASLEGALEHVVGSKTPHIAELGLGGDRGAAVFAWDSTRVVAILPVVDRAKFVAQLHGKAGTDRDTFGFGSCRPLAVGYACATSEELFARIGKGSLRSTRRGDIEIAGAGLDVMTKRLSIDAAVELQRGTVVVRAVVGGFPTSMRDAVGEPVKPRLDPNGTAGFGLITFGTKPTKLPMLDVVPGLDANDMIRAGSGPATLVIPAGTATLDLRATLTDPPVIQKLIDRCPQNPLLAPLGATVERGRCRIAVPGRNFQVEAWIDGRELHIGTPQHASGDVVAITRTGAELATQPWSFAAWARMPLSPLPAAIPIGPADPDLTNRWRVRALFLLNEVGLGVRLHGDKLELYGVVRTLWANPDDVVAKIAKLGDLAELTAIAASAPSSPLAADVKAGPAGVIAATEISRVFGLFAIGVALDINQKIESSEALKQLHSISPNLHAHAKAYGGFPVGDLKPSPISCCRGPNRKCPAADWSNPVWHKLQFDIATPTDYRYGYHSDGKTAEVVAIGDLDCDGKEATYTLRVELVNGEPTSTFTEPPAGVR